MNNLKFHLQLLLKQNRIALLLLLLFIYGCEEKQVLNDNTVKYPDNSLNYQDTTFYKLSVGNNHVTSSEITDFRTKLFYFLNNSCDDSIKREIKVKFSKFEYATYTGYSLNSKDPLDAYLSYRINEYMNDVSFGSMNNKVGNVSSNDTLFNELCEMEDYYIRGMQSKDDIGRQNQSFNYKDYTTQIIKIIDQASLKNRNNLRLKYMVANLYYNINDYEKAIPIYDTLINVNYYKYKSLIKISECYLKRNNDKNVEYVLNKIKIEYPYFCNTPLIERQNYFDDKYYKACNDCLLKGTEREQIIARIFMCKYLLKNNEIEKVKSLIGKMNLVYNGDSLKKWERSEYYDIYIRLLFKEKKHYQICEFINTKVGLNDKVNVGNSSDLKKLLYKYNNEYKLYNNAEFEKLFKEHFENCIITNTKEDKKLGWG